MNDEIVKRKKNNMMNGTSGEPQQLYQDEDI